MRPEINRSGGGECHLRRRRHPGEKQTDSHGRRYGASIDMPKVRFVQSFAQKSKAFMLLDELRIGNEFVDYFFY